MTWPFSLHPSKHESYWLITIFTEDRSPLLSDRALACAFVYLFVDISFNPEENLVAWGILPDHIHLLVRTRDPNIFIAYILKESSSFFPNLLSWSVDKERLDSDEDLQEVFLLMHEEPVWIGASQDPLDYSFSSYHDYLRRYGLAFDAFYRTHRPLLPKRPWHSTCVFSSQDSSPEP